MFLADLHASKSLYLTICLQLVLSALQTSPSAVLTHLFFCSVINKRNIKALSKSRLPYLKKDNFIHLGRDGTRQMNLFPELLLRATIFFPEVYKVT